MPDWLIITVIGIVGLFILQLVFDPMVACCTLIRDSSLSLTQKLSSVVIPVTSISWMNSRKNHHSENRDLEDVESRVSGLEDDMQLFKNLMVKGNNHDTVNKRLAIAEESL